MKRKILRAVALLLLVSMLVLSMTGCDSLDYREAINLYNAQNYEDALALFTQLGEYEDSAQMVTRCNYWIAMKAMEYGRYEAAIEGFDALNGYEDSEARITECYYLLAVAAFEAEDLAAAESYFLEVADYKQAPEHLRRITWQKLFDAVVAAGTENEDGFLLQTERDGKTFQISARQGTPAQLTFFVSHAKEEGYRFYDDLSLSMTRDSLEASFTGTSTFVMTFKDNPIGSDQTSSGVVDIPTCTPRTQLVVTAFEKNVTDNLGKTTQSTDPADSLMQAQMQENFTLLMTVVPEMLAEAGIQWPLSSIGFSAM